MPFFASLIACVMFILIGPALEAHAQTANTSPQTMTVSGVSPSPQRPVLVIPPGLPRYDLAMRIDVAGRYVKARERIVFTNRSNVPVSELVFHVYPRYKVPDKDRLKLAKTMEVLRLSPDEAMDTTGHRMVVSRVFLGNRSASFQFDPKDETILVVPLPEKVSPGG